MTWTRTARLVLVPVLLGLLAACGGKSGSRAAPSLHSFVERVDRVCRGAPSGEERVTSLRRLRPPVALRDLYGHWMKAEQDALAASEAIRHPAEPPEGDALVPLAIAQGKIVGYARRLGADVCATGRAVTMPP